MEENKTNQVDEAQVNADQAAAEAKETKPEENKLPAVTVKENFLDKIQKKNYQWRLERAQKKAAKQPMTKAEKGAKIGLGIGVGLGVLGAVAGVTLRHLLEANSSDYVMEDDGNEEDDDGYFAKQLDGSAAEATEEEV